MTPFHDHTAATAPPGSRRMVAAAEEQFGFTPAPVGRMAASPQALGGFFQLNALFQKSSLDELARECLILTVATRNECHYCVAMHSATLARSGASTQLIDDLRAERPLPEPQLEALRVFVHQVMDHTGAVPDPAMTAFLAAGYTAENALDVVLGIATYTLSTFANRLTGASLDEPFRAWAWEKDLAATG